MYLKFNFYTYSYNIYVVMFNFSFTFSNFEEEIKICWSEFFSLGGLLWIVTVLNLRKFDKHGSRGRNHNMSKPNKNVPSHFHRCLLFCFCLLVCFKSFF